MILPLWATILGGTVLYLGIGAVQAMAIAYLSGRSGRQSSLEDEALYVFFWPALNAVSLLFMVFSKFLDLLEFLRKRGEESVLPPTHAMPGRPVQLPKEVPFTLAELEILQGFSSKGPKESKPGQNPPAYEPDLDR